MKNRISSLLILSVITCLFSACGTTVRAPKFDEDSPRAGLAAKHTQMPTPEQMQAAWIKASTPTTEHAFLKKFTGNWKTTSKWWMSPEAPPEVSKGKSTLTMDFGGKFLRQTFSGTANGRAFTGLGYTGFDTVGKEFSSVWLDSMSSIMMTSTGSYDAKTNTLTLAGSSSCPMAEAKIPMRMTMRLIDKNHHVFEAYTAKPDGTEFKAMEINYTRTK